MTTLAIGDKVRVTSRCSLNYNKIGVIVSIIDGDIYIKNEAEPFLNVSGKMTNVVVFAGSKVEWLSLEPDNTNIINLAAWCRNSTTKDNVKTKEDYSFDEIQKANKEKEEKAKIERLKHNRIVTRSYNLKR